MTSDKNKIISDLHTLQSSLFDTREYLAALPIGRSANELSHLYDMILKCETQLDYIVDEDFWG